jgi:hypothetical protein
MARILGMMNRNMKLSELLGEEKLKFENSVEITLRDELSWWEFLEARKIEDNTERGIFTLTKLITSWNITGEDGKIIPINEDTVKNMPSGIAIVLMNKINAKFDSKIKKKTKS